MNIERDPKYYLTGYKGRDPYKAFFYLSTFNFDGKDNCPNSDLIDCFNKKIYQEQKYKKYWLKKDITIKTVPKKIVIVNASSDDLPTSYETARIFDYKADSKGWNIDIVVVNTREELKKHVNKQPESIMVVSQCVNKKVYNRHLAKEFRDKGIVTVPGESTAPGSIFSDKAETYKLLSNNGRNWDMVARYKKIEASNKNIEDVAEEIINKVDILSLKLGKNQFFVKPIEGGGGLGGFRIIKNGDNYIIPDLSKVSGDIGNINPAYIDIDFDDEYKVKELFFIYNLFKSDPRLYDNYVKVKIEGSNYIEQFNNFKRYLSNCKDKECNKAYDMQCSREDIKKILIDAISKFENKFKYRYVPLVNEHIDFGNWGLRAHLRLSNKGPKLETIYARIFQLAFMPEGVGYVGSDNISNKQTGELEIMRLRPLNKIMIESVGGQQILVNKLLKCSRAIVDLAKLLPDEERKRVPLRIQLDIAAVSGRIGEVNADTARGLCLASSWDNFTKNAIEWFVDSIKYYSWRRNKHADL